MTWWYVVISYFNRMKQYLLLILILALPHLLASQKYADIDAHAQSVKLSKDYKQATQELVAPYEDETSKVRAIFSWLAYNLEYDNRRLKKITRTNKKGGQKINANTEKANFIF